MLSELTLFGSIPSMKPSDDIFFILLMLPDLIDRLSELDLLMEPVFDSWRSKVGDDTGESSDTYR